MPIGWGVDHTARLVSATARGELGRTDIEDYLEGLAAAATLSYRKVFDMSQCRLVLSKEDMLAIGARIRGHESIGPMGKVAVIVNSEEAFEQARLLEANVKAERPLKIFRDVPAAYDWLVDGLPDGDELSETQRLAAERRASH